MTVTGWQRLAVAVVALFIAVLVLWRVRPRQESTTTGATAVSAAEREAVRRFWDLYRSGTGHRIAGRTQQAVDDYVAALALNERHEDALYYLGNMYLTLGQFVDAERTWKRLVEVNPMSARAHSRLGDLHLCLEEGAPFDLSAAQADFERALQIYKEETGPVLRLGQIALLRGDLAGARAHFDAVVGSNFRSVEAYFLQGFIAWHEGDQGKASTLLARAAQYARPVESESGVAGEGDTKAGASPMVVQQARCRLFQPHVEDLGQLEESDIPAQLDRRYRRVRGLLGQVRRKLSA
ncbi:MAG: tetratricopeptide repeat protein [Gemmatimonadales bacterium]|nr:tetratricopeptide repeat protein [Gemmatimonadales bacterium]NIN11808.1 tetratricopeptide repeat protein [Gemmatimonadales bacterium]NIN50358.1 tetratricopeptide repeat protein [Gemmatimonadales bacterium]NIP07822.1 tetratricopeptide repeat protein [Gemmatimonadales bacterium]NIR01900.1 tetratricopeptide repeat protein [Gemmatimonadales bacterium]